jgi:hypothetical protein
MTVETRDMGLGLSTRTVILAADIFHTAVDRYEAQVRRIRVRLLPLGRSAGVCCKVRAWLVTGPEIVSTTNAPTLSSSLHEAAKTLARSVRRTKGRLIGGRRVGFA